jgi:hypothetical protein
LNNINVNVLSGYQESNLVEMGDNLVHNGNFIHLGPKILDYTRLQLKIGSSGTRQVRNGTSAYTVGRVNTES